MIAAVERIGSAPLDPGAQMLVDERGNIEAVNPAVIVEVLSPTTEAWDRGGKFDNRPDAGFGRRALTAARP